MALFGRSCHSYECSIATSSLSRTVSEILSLLQRSLLPVPLRSPSVFTGWPQKIGTIILYALTLPILTNFQNFFHYQNQEKICNNTITKDPTTPQVCPTLPCEISSVLKATIENMTTSVTTHFKKLTTGNNVCCLSYCLK